MLYYPPAATAFSDVRIAFLAWIVCFFYPPSSLFVLIKYTINIIHGQYFIAWYIWLKFEQGVWNNVCGSNNKLQSFNEQNAAASFLALRC